MLLHRYSNFTWKNTCQNWFARFRSVKFDLNDKDRSGGPAEADDEKLEEILEEDPRTSTRKLAIELAVSQTTVKNRLKRWEKFCRLENGSRTNCRKSTQILCHCPKCAVRFFFVEILWNFFLIIQSSLVGSKFSIIDLFFKISNSALTIALLLWKKVAILATMATI